MRGGIIATTPMEEYYFNDVLRHHFNMEKLNGFLIDANSFGGSSGSLVILKSQYSQIYKGNIVHSSQKAAPFVLGILTHSYPSVNTGDNSQRLALGGVISSEVIIETINQFPI